MLRLLALGSRGLACRAALSSQSASAVLLQFATYKSNAASKKGQTGRIDTALLRPKAMEFVEAPEPLNYKERIFAVKSVLTDDTVGEGIQTARAEWRAWAMNNPARIGNTGRVCHMLGTVHYQVGTWDASSMFGK